MVWHGGDGENGVDMGYIMKEQLKGLGDALHVVCEGEGRNDERRGMVCLAF